MRTDRALLYCAVNGIANNTNGVGRQTKTFLGTLQQHHAALTVQVGAFTPYLAVPEPGPALWGYDPADLAHARTVVEALGGRVIPLSWDAGAPMWRPANWQALSAGAARAAATLAVVHERVLVIGVDTPFAGLAHHAGTNPRVDTVLALFSTARITERPHPDPGRLTWETAAITAVNQRPRVWAAGIGDFLTRHLHDTYGLRSDRVRPWPSGLHLTDPRLSPPTPAEAEHTARHHGIPTDRPLITAVGRTDRTKGLDLLIEAAAPLRDRTHLAMIAVPTDDDRARLLDVYRERCAALRLDATVVGHFDPELPRALAALPTSRVMAVPSLGETLANIVFETCLWARGHGSVVLAPAIDGFPEQITDGHNGLLYHPTRPGALTAGLRRALGLTETERSALREAAHRRVAAERDAARHLATLLTSIWPSPPGPGR
ncbi:glycosyltransferase family 4 protein [Streptomyces qinzhouensis]|uniref:Glycosyltransferase family 4 protein n=1 Tax=Streptomyces qinzhouensis TaxID=2599401 RepID=A0A5B8IE04_9ACTN|nr:glycosyltransferase family 4 protein [Streptomyces qinzhouensis]QDY75339.1 glycosyltransferase family 4 protein [Streptomyces qinzhouensis]